MTLPSARSSPLWPLVVLLLGFAAITAIAIGVMPPDHLDHAVSMIGTGISWFVSNPAGAVATITAIASAVVTVLVLLHITPPAWLLAMTSRAKTSSSSSSSTSGFAAVALLVHVLGIAAFALAGALLLGLLPGCGGARLSDSQHAALALETQRCLVNEREIVDRPDTTQAQDDQDMAAERARCDSARAAIVNGSADAGAAQ